MKNGDLGDYDFKPKLSKHELILERYKTLLNTSSSGEISKSIKGTEKLEKENLKINEINNKLSEMLYTDNNSNSLNFLLESNQDFEKKFGTYANKPNLKHNKINYDIHGNQAINHNYSVNQRMTFKEKNNVSCHSHSHSSSDVIENIKNKYLSNANNFGKVNNFNLLVNLNKNEISKQANPNFMSLKIMNTLGNKSNSSNGVQGIFNNPEVERIRNKYSKNNSPQIIQEKNISKENNQKSLLEEMLLKYKKEVNNINVPETSSKNLNKEIIGPHKNDLQLSFSEEKKEAKDLKSQNSGNKFLSRLEILEETINKLKNEKCSNLSSKIEGSEGNESILTKSIDSIKSVEEKISNLKNMRKKVQERHKEKIEIKNDHQKSYHNNESIHLINKILENVTDKLFIKEKEATNFQIGELKEKSYKWSPIQNRNENVLNKNNSLDLQSIDPPKIKNKILRSRTNSNPKKKIQTFDEFIQNSEKIEN
jgi:hypothetical protein